MNMLPVFEDVPDHKAWAEEIFQWIYSNNIALPSAQTGEMMYVANQWKADLKMLPSNLTDLGETAFNLWSQRW